MVKSLLGIHHVSAITKDAKANYDFYTKILGLRLVKKTVNQDETSMYHLFYADEKGNPGTDLTFFEIPNAGKTFKGTNSISGTSLRVVNDEALRYWKKRFEDYNIEHEAITFLNKCAVIPFCDPEGQRLFIISDENNSGVEGGKPWTNSPVPENVGIIGLGPTFLTVSRLDRTERVLTDILGFRKTESYFAEIEEKERKVNVFETGKGGNGAEVHVIEVKDAPRERPGKGSVHHVAFRVENEKELHKWVEKLNNAGIANSGFVERYYFKSLYFREPNGILFELATDGPGFETDEEYETLGETLALPPYLENKRDSIEAKLKPLDTTKS
ncbi:MULTISPECIES: ring-cleaving dioxygenase [Bacillaceae]|uniref:Ring-cleaving dioxygenase n=1 Tax=Evansella alkalicola TaxID=745819 RepID=A0ABS6JTX4_9BACI|nr:MULTISPECIES: ring-cleaving dioxygenase [Bacillaceae]MBU9722038.1 ring-cleaving dioxygenase [Bacillus alkalicola]